jgi:hypothetical protein
VATGVYSDTLAKLERANERLQRVNMLLVSIVMDRGGKLYVPEPALKGKWRLEVDDQSTSEGVTLVLVEDVVKQRPGLDGQ